MLFFFRGRLRLRLLSPPVIPPFTDDNKAHLISARVEKEEEEEDEGASLPDLTTRGHRRTDERHSHGGGRARKYE